MLADHLCEIETLTKEDIYELAETGKLGWWEKKKAKEEAERIARKRGRIAGNLSQTIEGDGRSEEAGSRRRP